MSMRFRTELAPHRASFGIGRDEPVLLLGSCFSDSVGERLGLDGFDVLANPFGALYNPLSIENCLRRAVEERAYTAYDLRPGPRGFHCLDYATRFSGADAEDVLADVGQLGESLDAAQRYCEEVLPLMKEVRHYADLLETRVADDLWALPNYQEILFGK